MHLIEETLLEYIKLNNSKCLHHSSFASLIQTPKLEAPSQQTSAILIAYSGGLDSSVLLHCAWQLYNQQLIARPTAAHVNHGLQPLAGDWQIFCQNICDDYQIPLLTESLQLFKQGKTSEHKAREERYQFFEKIVKKDQLIAMAHHQNDQAETILFRLIRGSGLHGMRGIPSIRKLGKGQLIRPLLQFSRQELENYATQNKLSWIDDPSNQNSQYDRNFIRNNIMPLLLSKWSSVTKKLVQFSQIASEQIEILEDVAKQDLSQIAKNFGTEIIISELLQRSQARQKNILHYWVRKHSSQSPSMMEINELLKQIKPLSLNSNQQDKTLKIKMSTGWVRSFNGRLFYCFGEEPCAMNNKIVWADIGKKLKLNNGLTLFSTQTKCENLDTSSINLQLRLPKDDEVVTVRPRVGGEKIQPTYRNHSTQLKNIYQELKVPVWKRKWLPIIFYNELLVAVPGVFIEHSVEVKQGGVVFELTQKIE